MLGEGNGLELHVICNGGDLRGVQRYARAALDAGVSGMLFTEASRTAYLAATAAGLAADGLQLSTGVAVAFPRSPMVTAQVAWELTELTGGRFRLGLGSQVRRHVEQRYAAAFDHPGPRLREYVLALRAVFAAFAGREPLAFEGEFYRLSFLPPAWSPGPSGLPDPPVDVAAVNPWMLRMAGEVADGVHVHPLHSVGYLDEVVRPSLAAGTTLAGRSVDDVVVTVPVLTIVGDTDHERAASRRFVTTQLGFYGSTAAYRFQLERLGYEDLQPRLQERLQAGDLAGLTALLPDELVAELTVEATWDELADALRARYTGRAHRLVAYLADEQWRREPTTLERWGEVARALQRSLPSELAD